MLATAVDVILFSWVNRCFALEISCITNPSLILESSLAKACWPTRPQRLVLSSVNGTSSAYALPLARFKQPSSFTRPGRYKTAKN